MHGDSRTDSQADRSRHRGADWFATFVEAADPILIGEHGYEIEGCGGDWAHWVRDGFRIAARITRTKTESFPPSSRKSLQTALYGGGGNRTRETFPPNRTRETFRPKRLVVGKSRSAASRYTLGALFGFGSSPLKTANKRSALARNRRAPDHIDTVAGLGRSASVTERFTRARRNIAPRVAQEVQGVHPRK